MTRYLQWIEKTEGWRNKAADRHATDRFFADYDIIYDSDEHAPDPDAIKEFANAAASGDYDLIYCDEDVIRDNERCDPFFKPGYSPDTQKSTGYIEGMIAVRKGADRDLESFERDKVCHIEKVLYHRLKEKEEGIRGLEEKEKALPEIIKGLKVSVVVLSKDHPDLFRGCEETLRASFISDDIEIILVDNGSSEENRSKYEGLCKEGGIYYLYNPMDFNYSALNNIGADKASGDVIVFMNDDIEVPKEEKGIVEKLAAKAVEQSTGAVGVKLLYPDLERIQHCGVVILKSGPSHKLQGYEDRSYYHGFSDSVINATAVTGAVLAVEKKKFVKAGGFDEKLPVAYNDVDLCLRLHEEGLYNVCINTRHLVHYESATRPDDRGDRDSFLRLKGERDYFYEKHQKTVCFGDLYINSNITGYGLDFDIDLPMEWEESGIGDVIEVKRKVKIRSKIHAALDRFDYRLGDAYGNEDFYELSGWMFKEKKSGLKKGVLLKTSDKSYLVKASDMPRKDVAEVFPDQKMDNMAGFIARVSADTLDKITENKEITAIPVLLGRHDRMYKGKEECQKKRKI